LFHLDISPVFDFVDVDTDFLQSNLTIRQVVDFTDEVYWEKIAPRLQTIIPERRKRHDVLQYFTSAHF
jgi:hypothetical protein